jgi:hypothetical protein
MRFIIDIEESTLRASVILPSGEVTVYDRCDLSQSREIVPEYDEPGQMTMGKPARYVATGKESLTLSMTSVALSHRRVTL